MKRRRPTSQLHTQLSQSAVHTITQRQCTHCQLLKMHRAYGTVHEGQTALSLDPQHCKRSVKTVAETGRTERRLVIGAVGSERNTESGLVSLTLWRIIYNLP